MKIHTYFKNNKMAMWSESKIEAPGLEYKNLTITQAQFEKFKQNLDPILKDGKLEFEKDKPTVTEVKIDDLKTRVASGEDTKTLLTDILDLIINN